MIYLYIISVLGELFYFLREGLVQSWVVSGDESDDFHWARVGEWIGMALHILPRDIILIALLGNWNFLILMILTIGPGLPIYEFTMRKKKYGNMFAEKTGDWLGIKQPKVILWQIIFVCTAAIEMVVLIKMGG